MIHDSTTGNNYDYDAENRITGAAGFTYTYDADGNRVEKSNGTTGTIYWYMTPGIVAESDLKGNLKSEYIFFDGDRVARKDFSAGAVSYYFSDHLKTASVITDSAGNIKSDSDFFPFGAELQWLTGDTNKYRYGGHELDTETGNYYYGAREYSPAFSRFLTPDWAGKPTTVPYANVGYPQSLNLYTYSKNNPTTFGDPDGHCPTCTAVWEGAEAGAEAGAPFGPWGVAVGTVVGGVGAGVGLGYLSSKISANLANQSSQAPHNRPLMTSAKPGEMPKPTSAPAPGTQTGTQPGTRTGTQTPGQQGATPPPPNPTGPSQPKSNPIQGTPGGTSTTTQPDGSTKQTRTYGPDGYPKTDVDHGHDHGAGDPHAHDWGRPADGSPPTHQDRGPGRPLKPDDPK